MTLTAGAAKVEITPEAGVPMGGYGARTGVAEGTHDPLYVRTLVLTDGTTVLALAVCDLVGVGPDIVGEARRLVERDLGVPGTNVMVSATHTHSGPMNLWTRDAGGYAATTAAKVAESVRLAMAAAVPVRLKLASAHVDTVSQNRRDPAGPIQTDLSVLVAESVNGGSAGDGAAGGPGRVVATVLAYACHATVLEHDNLLFSADFPGAACAAVEAALGGTAIYLQGAAGDINPVWLRHDFDEVDRVGGIIGATAARTAHELVPLGEVQRVVNLSWSEDLEVPSPAGVLVDDVTLGAAIETVTLERRPLPPQAEIAQQIKLLELDLDQVPHDEAAVVRRLRPRLNQLRMEWVFAGPTGRSAGTEDVEVQVLRISPQVAIAGFPGELLVGIGQEVAADAAITHVLVAGYANGYIGYVPRAEDFFHAGYEVGSARFGPGAAAALVAAGRRLLAELADPAPDSGP